MIEKKQVLHSNGKKEVFKPRLIKEQLLRETDISEELAEKIKIRVAKKLIILILKKFLHPLLEQRCQRN